MTAKRKKPRAVGRRRLAKRAKKSSARLKLRLAVKMRRKKRAKKTVRRNPKPSGHFVYVEKGGVKFWLTPKGELHSNKIMAKHFSDLVDAKRAARGLGPKLPDSVEGVWIT